MFLVLLKRVVICMIRLPLSFLLFLFIESNLGETRESYEIKKSKILEKLHKSIIEQTDSKQSEMNVHVEKPLEDVKDLDEAVKLINGMDKMIKIKKNNTLTIARKQGEIFEKFKTNNKFISAVNAFNICKTTINFKIGIVEFISMYPKMEKSCIFLYYLKNNFKIIKEVCKENATKFQ